MPGTLTSAEYKARYLAPEPLTDPALTRMIEEYLYAEVAVDKSSKQPWVDKVHLTALQATARTYWRAVEIVFEPHPLNTWVEVGGVTYYRHGSGKVVGIL